MNKSRNIFLIVFIVVVIMLYFSLVEYFEPYENFDIIAFDKINIENKQNKLNKLKWTKNKCDYVMNETILNELKANGLTEDSKNWNLYFPCAYDDISKEVNLMPIVKGAKYFILENCDEIVAKELLWKYIVNHYDYQIAKTLMPNSYILYENKDLERFSNEYDQSKIYIMKKNIQRQEGLKITTNKDEILKGISENYVVVQELLQNPYIISGRKTNMRFYILVVCKGNDMNVFVYKNGFMYYTKELFKVGSVDDGPNITTGYIDRKVYEENPLTHEDLKTYLDDPNRKNLLDTEIDIKNNGLKISEIYFNRIYHLIRQIFTALYGRLTKTNKFDKSNVMFQLFGADIAVDNKLNPTIMEINKGPDLGAKDERDSMVKRGVIKNMLKVIGTLPYDSCDDTMFLKVLDITNGIINYDNKNNCSL